MFLWVFILGCARETKIVEPSDDGSVIVDNDSDGFDSSEDCDDFDSGVYPGSTEICDGIDNNCDGEVDEGVTFSIYLDVDSDGYGDDTMAMESCSLAVGYSLTGSDCNDRNENVFPGNTEICDGIDNDCNHEIDDDDGALDLNSASVFFQDADEDGYGSAIFTISACQSPQGWVDNNRDCDDTLSNIHPEAIEICDGIDNDCDTLTDMDDPNIAVATGNTYYQDFDEDGFGNDDVFVQACTAPEGYVGNNNDCDDIATHINPSASEICDSLDNDCDYLIDDLDPSLDLSTATLYYVDADADGFGHISETDAFCLPPLYGYVTNNEDCNDSQNYTYPGAAQLEGEECLSDLDNDGFAPLDQGGRDCNDLNPSILPTNTDIVGDTIDQNCDGIDGTDIDGDGFASLASGGTDCDDTNAARSPTLSDTVGDGIDNNCDGIDGVDGDGDGFASISSGGSDCDDTDSNRFDMLGSEDCPAVSCAEIIEEGFSNGDDIYWLDPTGHDPIELFCDMTTDGGGWTLIAKTAAGNYSALSDQAFINLIANPIQHIHEELLQYDHAPNAGEMAFLDRDTTNALFASSSLYVVRVTMSENNNEPNNNRTYYQQKLQASASWDLWHAIRNSSLWGTHTSGSYLSDFGTAFTLGVNFDETTGLVLHDGDGSFGAWDYGNLAMNNGELLTVTRHMGLLCDGWGGYGNQWLFTSNPNDPGGRFKADTLNAKSVIFFK